MDETLTMCQQKTETITISKSTKNQLDHIGKFGDTYDTIIKTLLQHANFCDRFWEDRF